MLLQRFFARMLMLPFAGSVWLRPLWMVLVFALASFSSCKTSDAKHQTLIEKGNSASNQAISPQSTSNSRQSRQAGLHAKAKLPSGVVQNLHYSEMITGNASPSDALPMIVAIHGLGDTPEGFARLLQDFPIPARIILPRGLDAYDGSFGQGWSWFPFRARDPDIQALSRGIHKASESVANAVTELAKQRPTAGKPLVTGFSQGGMLSFSLAAEFPELFRMAIPISGWLPPPLWPDSTPPSKSSPRIIALHGDADPAVKIEPTRLAVNHLSKLGFDIKLQEFPGVKHEIPPFVRAELFRVLEQALDQKFDQAPKIAPVQKLEPADPMKEIRNP